MTCYLRGRHLRYKFLYRWNSLHILFHLQRVPWRSCSSPFVPRHMVQNSMTSSPRKTIYNQLEMQCKFSYLKIIYNLNYGSCRFQINLLNSPQFTFSSSPLITVLLSLCISHKSWLQSSIFVSVQFEDNHFFDVSFSRDVYN